MAERIVLIPVDANDSKGVCDKLRHEYFDNVSDVVKKICDLVEDDIEDDVLIYTVSEFCEACNDQQFDSLSGYFMCNINIY